MKTIQKGPAQRIVIFGNSGSGKSTMAKMLVKEYGLVHLDLDTLAWEPNKPIRRPFKNSKHDLLEFITQNDNWVIEGCYSSLLAVATKNCTELRFLNPGVDVCIENCLSRPWEPHKYPSLEAQNENLQMLLAWVKKYDTRDDEFSLNAHRELFNNFNGKKTEYLLS